MIFFFSFTHIVPSPFFCYFPRQTLVTALELTKAPVRYLLLSVRIRSWHTMQQWLRLWTTPRGFNMATSKQWKQSVWFYVPLFRLFAVFCLFHEYFLYIIFFSSLWRKWKAIKCLMWEYFVWKIKILRNFMRGDIFKMLKYSNLMFD